MIILPDKNIARAKYLPPMLRCEWQAFGGDANIHFQTWLAQAYRADYSMVWQGHFEDREDADEFMAALISGVIKHDRYLRQLPVYCPDFDPDMLRDPSIQYNMVTNLGIGPSSGVWSAPGDCYGFRSRAGEFIDCIGPGGGAGSGAPSRNSTGGGGGGFARRIDLALTPGTGVSFNVGSGGAGAATTATGAAGAGGTSDTWFYSPANPGVQGNAGGGGNTGVVGGNPVGGGGGGAAAGNYGFAGGRGGNQSGAQGSNATGGGAAANPSGAGAAGGDISGVAATVSAGGVGAGLIYGPWGPGNGGVGVRGPSGCVGGAGENFGGGGGAACNNVSSTLSQTGGAGGGGLIVLRYEPTYQPTVSSISPTSGPTAGGQAVTISGANFVSVNAVNIGGAPVTGFSVPNTTTITGTTSAGGAGTHNVNVGVSSGPPAGIGASLYTYVAPPSVSSCSPAFGLTNVATLVIITGANMDGVNAVSFGGTPVTLGIAVSNSTTVYAWAPPHTAGLVNVVVSNSYGTGTGTNLFNYVLPASGFNMPGMGV